MAEPQSQQVSQTVAAQSLRLRLGSRLQIWSADRVIAPTSKKARALLALVALSEGRAISRQHAAALLWSGVDRSVGLARLRDTLHNLHRELREAGVEAFLLQGALVSLLKEVTVELDQPALLANPGAPHARFLAEFEGIDPALDQWLILTRKQQQRPLTDLQPQKAVPHPTTRNSAAAAGPSVVVAAFDATGTRNEQQFVRGLTEEVGGALTRLRWFTVITRRRDGRPISSVSEDLALLADYALFGNLQQDSGQYRLSIKLMDVDTCAIVWAATFVQDKSPGFTAQERFAASVAASVDTELLFIEADGHRRDAPLRRGEAYSLVLQAIPAIHRLERDPFLGAGHALEQAVAADRELAMAHSWLAYWHMFFVGQGWATNPAQSMARAGKVADRAMMLDPKDARSVTVAGHVKAFLNRRLDEAAALHELALQLNPAMALAWHFAGVNHAYSGRLEEADRCINRCRELAPADPHGFYAEGAIGIVRLLQHDHEAAVTIGRRVTERHPQFSSAFKSYLSALGHLGHKSEATLVLQRLHALEPRFSLHRFHVSAPYQRPDDLEHFMTGLRLAGVT